MDLEEKYFMFGIYQRNKVVDLQPNEPDSAPPITGAIAGPTYIKIRKDCIGKH